MNEVKSFALHKYECIIFHITQEIEDQND